MMIVGILSALLAGSSCHYVILFGQQNTLCEAEKDLHYSHSFGTWVETDEEHNVKEVFTISWSGTKGVKLFSGPQWPINRDLEASLARSVQRCTQVTMYGPYRVTCSAFRRAKCQYNTLEAAECSGCPKYTVIDTFTKHLPCPAFNCIHALLDITGDHIKTGDRNGNEVTELIVCKFREYGVITGRYPEDEWVWEAVRPEGYHVHRKACP